MSDVLRRAGQSGVKRAPAYCHFIVQTWIVAQCNGDGARWNIDNWVLPACAFRP
jgi:hypothetical protein